MYKPAAGVPATWHNRCFVSAKDEEDEQKRNECEKNTLPLLAASEKAQKGQKIPKTKIHDENAVDGMQLWAANDGEEKNRSFFSFSFSLARSFVIRYDTKHIIKYKNS